MIKKDKFIGLKGILFFGGILLIQSIAFGQASMESLLTNFEISTEFDVSKSCTADMAS